MLPGKRESRRYIGDHVMTQDELRAGGHFEDVIAFGGWSMDNHEPEGFLTPLPPTTYHAAPSPYGIPYRCLYSEYRICCSPGGTFPSRTWCAAAPA